MPTQTRLELHHLNGLAKHGQSREFWHEFGVLCDNWEDDQRPGWEWVRRIHEERLWPWRRDGFGWCLGVVAGLLWRHNCFMCDCCRSIKSRSWAAAVGELLELTDEAQKNRANLQNVLELRYMEETVRYMGRLTYPLLMQLSNRHLELGRTQAALILSRMVLDDCPPLVSFNGWGFRGSSEEFPTWADAVQWAITRHMESPS